MKVLRYRCFFLEIFGSSIYIIKTTKEDLNLIF